MNAFASFLKAAGHDLKVGLDVIIPVAQAATPFVSIANPAIGALMSTTIGLVVTTEQKFSLISATDKQGPQKLAEVTAILAPVFISTFKQYGMDVDVTHVSNFINGIVAVLNTLPPLPAQA